MHDVRPFAAILLFAASLPLLGSCQQLPREPGLQADVLTQGDALRRLNPNDIAIPPIRNLGEGDLPERELREAFLRGLVRQRYAPLSLDYVDSAVVDASYVPGYRGEEAVLQIVVHRWDDSLWEVQDRVVAEVEVRMLDAANPQGPALWAASLSDTFVMTDLRERSVGDDAVIADLCLRIANTLCSNMPPRLVGPE